MTQVIRRVRVGALPSPGAALFWAGMVLLAMLAGCRGGPTLLKPPEQTVIDRRLVEYPAATELRPFITGLTGPTAMTFDGEGSLIITEGGWGDRSPRIYGFKQDGTFFEIYPKRSYLPRPLAEIVGRGQFRMFGPIGGLAYANGRLYVSHRDDQDRGVITAFASDGTQRMIVADLPAQGDYAVTDIVVTAGRLYFGVGSATNSGVVGLDNFRWVQQHRSFCDGPWMDLYLLGRRFDTLNPFAGLFGGTDLAVTAPFQPFGKSIETRIPKAPNGKPDAAIYSVDVNGGDLRVEAHGIRYPVGLGFSETGALYVTNQGMKLRGTRPVKDDPDVLLRWVPGQWYGWPDYSANLLPIRDARFQPPVEMIVKTGYRDLSFLIDHETSHLVPPSPYANLVMAEFRALAGASKFAFAPSSGPFSRLRQAGNVAVVALWGDRAPFDSGNLRLIGPTGYKVVQVNLDERQVREFVRNTREGPASRHNDGIGLERPIDVKFGPDGALYILDFGEFEIKGNRERVQGGTGKVFRLVGLPEK